MSNKYIIRNCPAYTEHEKEYTCADMFNEHRYCNDCTDCLLKQIVGLCRGNKEYALEYLGHKDMLAEEILQLLDIQECE